MTTKDTMKKLKIEGLRPTPTILQLADSSIVTPDGMIENIVVTLDSLVSYKLHDSIPQS